MLENSIEYANYVYSNAEFYGMKRNIHNGIIFEMGDYLIDTDEACNPKLR